MVDDDAVGRVTGDHDAPHGIQMQRIDHIGIAVRSIDEEAPMYRDVLGLVPGGEYVVADQRVKAAFLKVGESTLELLEPTDSQSTIATFLDKRGPGMHHIAYRVADIDAELQRLKGDGVRLIDEAARIGAGGARIAFLHPKATGGVLTELVQRDHEHV